MIISYPLLAGIFNFMNNRKQKNKRGKNPRQYTIQKIKKGIGFDEETGKAIIQHARKVTHLTSNQ